jgi:hypothetical protein
MRASSIRRGQRGQASVELVALLPVLVLVAAVCWQAVVAGQALWLSGSAARSAARAQAVGADVQAAARRALPRRLREGLRVERGGEDGAVRVRVRIPSVIAGIDLGTATGRARFAPQR